MERLILENYLLFTVLFVVGGTLAFVYAAVRYFLGQETKQWETTSGKVTYSNVSREEMRSRRTGRSVYFNLELTYEYVVDGQRFESQSIKHGSKGWRSQDEKKVRNFAKAYPSGKQVTVYYNPRSPKDAVLETGVPVEDVGTLVVVGALVYFAAIVIYFWGRDF